MIFIDRSIPRGVADALKAIGRDDVSWLEDLYAHNVKDEEWLPDAGANGWLVLSRDKKIMTRPGQRGLVIRHHVGMFVFNQRHDPSKWDYFKLLGKCLDEMERLFAATERPFIFVVSREGVIRRYDLARYTAGPRG